MAFTAKQPERTYARLVFLTAAGCYLLAAVWTILRWNLVMGDALSRLANASYSFSSRDPHLSAIGFVWNPLPTLVMIPVLAARAVWEPLGEHGFAASLASGLAMAFAVASLYKLTLLWTESTLQRVVVVVGFAMNPLVLLYATNGMSEAFMLAAIIPAISGLARFLLDQSDTGALVNLSLAFAVAYLVRYESLAALAAAAVCIAAVTFWKHRDDESPQHAVFGNLIVLLAPAATTVVLFALTSWLITGSPAAQFTSAYGNTSVLSSAGGSTLLDRASFSIACILVLAPLVGVVLMCALFARDAKRVSRIVAVIAVPGAVTGAALLLHAAGSTLPFLRFFITAALVHVLLALAVFGGWDRFRSVGTAVMVLVIFTGWVTTARGMLDPEVGVQEHQIASLVMPARDVLAERDVLRTFETERRVARYLDRLDLPKGAVLVDVLFGFDIVVASTNPEQFVIPSDRDFPQVLADPVSRGVQYLLTIPDDGRGSVDAINKRFPGIFEGTNPIGHLRMEALNDGAGPDWRLYEVVKS